MITRILLIIALVTSIIVGGYLFYARNSQGQRVEFNNTPESAFGEKTEYVNRQANFSFEYPNSWRFEIQELADPDTKGIRVRGSAGYVDMYWAPEHEKGGCAKPVSTLELQEETIEVCNFTQENKTEIWNQIVKDRGDMVFWADAFAASPSATTRQQILDIFSSLTFF